VITVGGNDPATGRGHKSEDDEMRNIQQYLAIISLSICLSAMLVRLAAGI
jgi:hypothetical protein